jgi:hypothetical protein
MCLTFEAKHQMTKNIRWFNFKNIPLSIMNHAVNDLAANLFLPSGDTKNDVFRSSKPVLRHRSQRATFNGVNYKLSDVLVFSKDETILVQILSFLVEAGNQLQLHVCKLKTRFISGWNLFEVEEKTPFTFTCLAEELSFPWPAYQRLSPKWLVFPVALPNLNHQYSDTAV